MFQYSVAGEEEDEGETFGVLNELFRYDCNPPEYRKVTYPKPTGPNEVVATPVFYKDKVYVLTGQDPEHGEGLGTLSCIDPSKTGDISGDTVWIYKGIERSMSTPAIVDDLLYTADYRGFAYCFDAMTGEKYWEYDTFGHIGSEVVTCNIGMAASMASFILGAGERGKRIALPHSRVMIHQPMGGHATPRPRHAAPTPHAVGSVSQLRHADHLTVATVESGSCSSCVLIKSEHSTLHKSPILPPFTNSCLSWSQSMIVATTTPPFLTFVATQSSNASMRSAEPQA